MILQLDKTGFYHISIVQVNICAFARLNGVSPSIFPSAPCPPKNVSCSLVCDNNTAAVSWQHSPSAVYYKVTANGRDGDVKQCTTNSTSCHLPNMHCAQTYVITITPFSSQCKGFESYPKTYVAGEVEPEKWRKIL